MWKSIISTSPLQFNHSALEHCFVRTSFAHTVLSLSQFKFQTILIKTFLQDYSTKSRLLLTTANINRLEKWKDSGIHSNFNGLFWLFFKSANFPSLVCLFGKLSATLPAFFACLAKNIGTARVRMRVGGAAAQRGHLFEPSKQVFEQWTSANQNCVEDQLTKFAGLGTVRKYVFPE